MGNLRLGRLADGSEAKIDPEILLDHTLIVGSKGTGKTTLGRQVMSEFLDLGCPVLAIDTTGDATASLMRSLELPLVTGLGPFENPTSRVRLRSLDLTVIESLFLLPAGQELSPELLADELDDLVAALLGLAGFKAKKLTPEFSLIEAIVWNAWSQGQSIGLSDLIAAIDNPPINKIGIFELDRVISADRRADLAGGLAGPLRSLPPGDGTPPAPIDFGQLLLDPIGSTTTVLSFASGASRIQKFLVAAVLAKFKTYLAISGRSDEGLSALLYLDEASTLLPAGRKGLTTKPLINMLETGRTVGLGVVLVVEELDDVDEDVEDLCQTWFVGNIPCSRARAAVVDNLDLITPPVDEVKLDRTIKTLAPGHFVLRSCRLDHLVDFSLD